MMRVTSLFMLPPCFALWRSKFGLKPCCCFVRTSNLSDILASGSPGLRKMVLTKSNWRNLGAQAIELPQPVGLTFHCMTDAMFEPNNWRVTVPVGRRVGCIYIAGMK